MNINSLYDSWIGISEDSGAFVSARQAQAVSSGVFFLPGVSVGYIQIFLALTRPHAPRANTLRSWATLLQEFHWASAAFLLQQNASLTWKDTAGSAGTYGVGVGLGIAFPTWHANVSSPTPAVYDQPVVLHGLSCSSRLCPKTGRSWDSWNTNRFV